MVGRGTKWSFRYRHLGKGEKSIYFSDLIKWLKEAGSGTDFDSDDDGKKKHRKGKGKSKNDGKSNKSKSKSSRK